MMKTFAVLVLVISFAHDNHGAVFYENQVENPEHPLQCLDGDTGTYRAIGDKWHPKDKCFELTCALGNTNGTLVVDGVTCQNAVVMPSNCKQSAPLLEAPYPECCPKLECEGPPVGDMATNG